MNPASIYLREDTIAALSSAPGQGAVALIRLSGPRSIEIVQAIFHPRAKTSRPAPRCLRLGVFIDPATGETIDEGMTVLFYAPASYTGESMAELHCHGSEAVIRKLLEILYHQGARPAEPGEFTFRAVRNGKMNLAQAEGVASLIASRSQLARALSLRLLEGAFSEDLAEWKEDLVSTLVEVETQIEFPDDVHEEAIGRGLVDRLESLADRMESIQRRAVREQRFEQGVLTVLAGRPNVGKSSLFNRLLGRDRAIVSPHPGTTRDSLEGTIELAGHPVTLIDTAGLRETQEEIEAIGVQRSRQVLTESHIILFIYEAAPGLTAEEIKLLEEIAGFSRDSLLVLVANKIDQLPPGKAFAPPQANYPWVAASALAPNGIDALVEQLSRQVCSLVPTDGESSFMITSRQERLLQQCADALARAREGSKEKFSWELVAEDLREALHPLAELDGSGVPPDIMAVLFSRFCIGK